MSVQFGRWNFEGKPPDQDYIQKVDATLAPYGPDSKHMYSNDGVTILYRAFHTTKESRHESQPHVADSGSVIAWDGNLDNRAELIRELADVLPFDPTDVFIVAAAYERWGGACFAKLIGDWALSIWNSMERCLTLAKDPIGTHNLYYSFHDKQVTWSTILDPLVRFAGKTFSLSEEYIAGWFSMFPAVHLTPYRGIHSVAPSTFVVLRSEKHSVSKYWDFDSEKKIRYRNDREYEEHFRTVFAKAVQRKLRSDCPVLAELSGGIDSSSIVCMADSIIACGKAESPRLDTVSFYDENEPSWNERPYFTKVEEKRGRAGWHIDVSLQGVLYQPYREASNTRFAATPGDSGYSQPEFGKRLTSRGNRIVLSGIGGDETMGGIPTPLPELQDLLAAGHLRALAYQLKVWALEKKKPWFHLLWETARAFFPAALVGVPNCIRPAPWLQPGFARRHRPALTGYPSRLSVLGSPPSFQDNINTLELLRRQLACKAAPCEPHYEKRYPYLDRDLLEFVFAIPRDQLVRPIQRRSLLRRALIGLVPDEILNRKRKAFVARAPLIEISREWTYFAHFTENMVSNALGFVDKKCILEVLKSGRLGKEIPTIPLARTLLVEHWLKSLLRLGIADLDRPGSQITWHTATQDLRNIC